jgi:hypothetical protein
MSSKNNVNPDYYKIAGRDKPNKGLLGSLRENTIKNILAKTENKRIFKEEGKSGGDPRSRQLRPSPAAREDQDRKNETDAFQTSNKSGVASTSEKQSSTRNYESPDPSANPVAGAFGRTGSLSEPEEEMIHSQEDADSDRNDFIAERRRQNERASK